MTAVVDLAEFRARRDRRRPAPAQLPPVAHHPALAAYLEGLACPRSPQCSSVGLRAMWRGERIVALECGACGHVTAVKEGSS